ncbi:MAG: division/cell wall cluster transcriptional repressor MraZ [Gammaproteobacteria bacterium]|nr:division/cell wall cluster transcriptional repressor MraZ [Gammaproteobacteria bacterium]
MFRGISKASLDDRGRFAMPARFRDGLRARSDSKLVITIDRQDKCLLLYPDNEWLAVEKRLERLSNLNSAVRQLQRMLMGFAIDVELDGNGRVLIPPILRDYAGIDKAVMVMGQSNKLELWSEDVLQAQLVEWAGEGNRALDDLEELDGIQL